MRVIAFPKNGTSYTECFYQAVERHGIPVLEGVFSGGWLVDNLRRDDWLHLHWPSFSYRSRGRLREIRGFARFAALLLLARLRGARITWTAHNLYPHDRSAVPLLDALARHMVIALAHVVPVHGEEAARALVARFPTAARKLLHIPHGHWIDHYPRTLSRAQARERLAIGEHTYTYLFVGLCKPYKNVDGLVRAFRDLPGDAQLIVAGRFQDPAYEREVTGLAAADARIRIVSGYVPDEDLQLYLMACDIVVVPYREILTSGTAMLAMSFGRPLLSIRRGFLLDVVNQDTGVLYSPRETNGLARALLQARTLRFDEQRILEHARQYQFGDAAHAFLGALGQRLPQARREAGVAGADLQGYAGSSEAD